jgi:hypothetical protein
MQGDRLCLIARYSILEVQRKSGQHYVRLTILIVMPLMIGVRLSYPNTHISVFHWQATIMGPVSSLEVRYIFKS